MINSPINNGRNRSFAFYIQWNFMGGTVITALGTRVSSLYCVQALQGKDILPNISLEFRLRILESVIRTVKFLVPTLS